MKKFLALSVIALTATASAQTFSTQPFELGLTGGYAGGLSGEVFVHAPFISGPFGIKAGVSYARPTALFNENGSFGVITYGEAKRLVEASGEQVREAGSNVVIGVDGTYSLGELAPGLDASVYAGGRYGLFNRSVSFGAETTTYTSNTFGIGAGVMASYPLSGNVSLVGDLGVDHFFDAAVTTSNADGTYSVNPGEAGYSDTRNLVNFPGTYFKARVGFKFMF
ncbi:hypothetical protein [Deinococcus navajonensis]|uniref:Outer membrane protein beta-barrel domain-containing protein n=1 Tax=Deinococcus navajonensis TaxID=309884 RepID=A0ABV8XJ60_9DEIO